MREQALATPADRADPHRNSADTRGSAELAVPQDGSGSIYVAGNLLSRMIYNSSYMLSYGVVFPVMMVVRVVPKNNAMVHGLVDGALAARESVTDWGAAPATEHTSDSSAHESEAVDNGSSQDGQVSEKPHHRRRVSKRSTSPRTSPKRSPRKG